MNSTELLAIIFDGYEGDVDFYDKTDCVHLLPPTLHTGLPPDVCAVDLVMNGQVFGIVLDSGDKATFTMERDGKPPVYVGLLADPVSLDLVPEIFAVTIPLPEHGWAVKEYTDVFSDLETLLEVQEDVSGSVEEAPEVSEEPAAQTLNDAYILGEFPDEMNALLNREATLLLGDLYGARDPRNTQDGKWISATMPWKNWIIGGAKTKNSPVWGFSRHPVAKFKEGTAIVLGSSIDGARQAKAMDTMFAMGLDIDSGTPLDTVLDKIEALGLFCLIYTSFNHNKRGLQLKRDEVLKKLQIKSDPSLIQIKEFLVEHSKSRYDNDFVSKVEILEARKQIKTGVVIELDTPPLEKFRLIFPLDTPVKLIDTAQTHEDALKLWEDKITGLAVELLDVHFDTSCTDPSRLFFAPRHAADAEDWYCAVIAGKPLKYEEVPTYKKSAYAAKRDKLSVFEQVGDDIDHNRPPLATAPSGMSLNAWHSTYKSRFMLADLLETYCSDRIRVSGGEAAGHVHIECPFEHEHSSEGGTATMAINCIDNSNEYWTWFCKHDACTGRHKLAFLEKSLADGWFSEDLLHPDAGFILEAEDQEEDAPPDAEDVPQSAADVPQTAEEIAGVLNKASTQADIEAVISRLYRRGSDLTERANVTAQIAASTNLGKREVKSIWAALDDEKRQKEKEKDRADGVKGEGAAIVNDWDFIDLCKYGHKRIHDMNAKHPSVFHYMENLCLIRENAEGQARMKFMDKDGFAHHLNNVARFAKTVGDDDKTTGVSAPEDVVRYLYAADYSIYPELRGLVTTPAFTQKGTLLTKPGYDPESRLYYKPDANLVVGRINPKPSEEEVNEAKRLLIEEILADFPLGGLTRPEIVDQALYGDGVPAVTNMIAMMLLPFMRDMVVGPSPGHLLTKPAPGTGASLLVDVFSIITTGRVTPALAMPTNKDEMSKTLTSLLANGQNIIFFDNINHSVDSGELASAMTAPTYQARLLGKSQTIEVDVRCVWTFTGNNVKLSSELVRRLIMIDLDARIASPELRVGFRHDDIRGWCTENRSRLVEACLTLIQNFIAKGMPLQQEAILASYENWSRIVGGVLKAAGLKGFMKNRDALRSKSDDAGDDDFMLLLETWWDACGSKSTPIKGESGKPGLLEIIMAEEILLPLKQTRNADGENTYTPRVLGSYLGTYKDRVFKLDSGDEVVLTRSDKRTKSGYNWQLQSNRKAPVSNVGAA